MQTLEQTLELEGLSRRRLEEGDNPLQYAMGKLGQPSVKIEKKIEEIEKFFRLPAYLETKLMLSKKQRREPLIPLHQLREMSRPSAKIEEMVRSKWLVEKVGKIRFRQILGGDLKDRNR